MNIHHLAVQIAKREGGKKQVDIAQIKQILKVMLEIDIETKGKVTNYFASRRVKNNR